MPFSIPSTIGWFNHFLLNISRLILGRQPEYFVDRYKNKNIDLVSVRDGNGVLLLCPICSFAIAELKLLNNWSARTCSAAGLPEIVNNPNFDQWQSATLNAEHLKN